MPHAPGLITQICRTAKYIWDNPSNRGQRLKRTALMVIWQLYKRLVGIPLLLTLDNGFKFVAEPRSRNSTGVIYSRLYEPEYTLFLRDLFDDSTGLIAVDVGAHVGLFSLQLAQFFKTIYCFEPAPDTFALLQQNAALNHFGPLVPFQLAVSDAPGLVRFRIDGPYSGTNQILCHSPAEPNPETVTATTLDAFFETHGGLPDLAFLKIDTEGHEVAVLRGAHDVLSHSKSPIVLIENSGIEQISQIAAELSMEVFALVEGRLTQDLNFQRKAYNLILARANNPKLSRWNPTAARNSS